MQAPKKLPRFFEHYTAYKEVHTCTKCGGVGIHIATHVRQNLIVDFDFECSDCGDKWMEAVSH